MKKLFIFLSILAGLMLAGNGYALTVTDDITTNTTWSEDVLLIGPRFVRAPATLTVNAGVTVRGEKASLAALVIDRGAKLIAIGTENSPVVFTSDQPEGQRKRADWGGLVINGSSPLNVGTLAYGEGDTGYYGCDENLGVPCNAADNSGTLRYVRVEYGGIQFSPDNEMNGIALQGTGSGTTLDHIQIYYSKDDGLEFFGGTTNVKNIICTGSADDSFDWTHGWRGSAQFVVVQHQCDTGDCDKGIEADNIANDYNALPRSNPTMYNFTLIGDPINGNVNVSTNGMLLRRGTSVTARNFIVQGFNRSGVDIDTIATMEQAEQGNLTVSNSIWWMNANNNMNFYDDQDDLDVASYPFTTQQFMTNTMQNNLVANPLLSDPYNWTDPDFRPAANSPAVNGTVPVAAPPAGNSFIVATNYIGAIDPAGDDWTRKPWTTYGARQGVTTTTTPAVTTTTTPAVTTTTTPAVTTTTTPATTTTIVNTTTTSTSGGGGGGTTSTTTSVQQTTTSIVGGTTTTIPNPPPNCTDNDKDGYSIQGGDCGSVDCNDTNAQIHPNAAESCNGVDDNCNGQIDEGVKTKSYADADKDGHGDPQVMVEACSAPAGYVQNDTDCSDNEAQINPDAEEVCFNGLDDNCNGQIDENGCKACPATQSLGAGNVQLDILRQYRDTVLTQSLKGKLYTRLYYYYAEEVSSILAADNQLKADSAALLESIMPAVQTALTADTLRLSAVQKVQVLRVLNKISKQSSIGLRLVIMIVKNNIMTGSIR